MRRHLLNLELPLGKPGYAPVHACMCMPCRCSCLFTFSHAYTLIYTPCMLIQSLVTIPISYYLPIHFMITSAVHHQTTLHILVYLYIVKHLGIFILKCAKSLRKRYNCNCKYKDKGLRLLAS